MIEFDTTVDIYVAKTKPGIAKLVKLPAKKYGYLAICQLPVPELEIYQIIHIATNEYIRLIGTLDNLISFCEKYGNKKLWKSKRSMKRSIKTILQLAQSCNLIKY